jgi:acetoacetate decarboxylase
MTQPISMPWSSPMFGELPHRWEGVRMAAFPFTPRPGAVARILPPGMEPADGPGVITLLSYPETAFQHPFDEAVVMVPVRVDQTLGNYVPYIYVTTDEALVPGREIAGFPKKLAQVEWGRDGDRVQGSVTRWGRRILSIEGRVRGPMPDDAAAGGGPGPGAPALNYKLVPGPAGEIEIEEITRVQIEVIPREREIGQARIRSEPSDLDPIADLVPEAEGVMIVMLSDNTIPAGEVLKQMKREVRI